MDYEYICKKCNELYEKYMENCEKCGLELFKIPICKRCGHEINNYPLDNEIDSQFCDFCFLSLCDGCAEQLGYSFNRCTECGKSFCFYYDEKTEKLKICPKVPIDENLDVMLECDCYDEIKRKNHEKYGQYL